MYRRCLRTHVLIYADVCLTTRSNCIDVWRGARLRLSREIVTLFLFLSKRDLQTRQGNIGWLRLVGSINL